MVKKNPFSITTTPKGNPFNTGIQKKVVEPSYAERIKTTQAPVQPAVQPTPGPQKQSYAQQYGLPESTISQAPPKTTEDPSLWNKIARTVLPKGAEEYFGLSQPETTITDRVKAAEGAKQSLFRGRRKEANIAQVTAPVEKYTPPTNFLEKMQESRKYGNYMQNVWSGFIKPAIGRR